MNQPSNTCGSWMNELSHAYHHYFHAPAQTYRQTTAWYQPSPNRDVVPGVDDAPAHGELGADEGFAYNSDDGWQQEDAPGQVVDAHPNTPSIQEVPHSWTSFLLISMQIFDEKISIILSRQG